MRLVRPSVQGRLGGRAIAKTMREDGRPRGVTVVYDRVLEPFWERVEK